MFSLETNFNYKNYKNFETFIDEIKAFSLSFKKEIDTILKKHNQTIQNYIITITQNSQKVFHLNGNEYSFYPNVNFLEDLNVCFKAKKEIIQKIKKNTIEKENKKRSHIFKDIDLFLAENSAVIFQKRFFEIQKYRFNLDSEKSFNFFPIKLKEFEENKITHNSYLQQIANSKISSLNFAINQNLQIFFKIAENLKKTEKRIFCLNPEKIGLFQKMNTHEKMDIFIEINSLYENVLSKEEMENIKNILEYDENQKNKQKNLRYFDFIVISKFNDMVIFELCTYHLNEENKLNQIFPTNNRTFINLLEIKN